MFRRVIALARPYHWQAVIALLVIAQLIETPITPMLVALLLGPIFEKGHGDDSAAFGVGADQWVRIKEMLGIQFASDAQRIHWVLFFSAVLLAAYAVRNLCMYWHLYLGNGLGQHVMHDLRARIFQKILRLSMSFHERHRVGELMSRTTSDVTMVQQLVTVLPEMTAAVVTIVTGLFAMLWLNRPLTLVAMLVGPLLGFSINRAGRRIRQITRTIQQRQADLSTRLQERLSAVKEVQSFVREDYEEQQFAQVNAQTLQANLGSIRIAALLYPMVEMMSMAAMVVAIAVAGWQVIVGNLGGPLIFAIFLIAQRIGSYAVKIGRVTLTVQQGLAAAARIFEILDTEPDVKEAPDAFPLPRVSGEVTFDSVSFKYDSGPEVLRNVNLVVKPGEVVALVGPSGAGKTSLVNLIPRFYDPTTGSIRIDGYDLRSVTLKSLRSQIGYVPQDTVLFAGSIYDNVRYGRLDATPEQIAAAAKAANADLFIESFPAGYQTEVGERGTKLSGGQRQRIAIARTLLKDPRILILDEATSSLDTESEALVQEALERLMAGRTTFVIAHRLSTVRNADRILVLSDGSIVEEGTHQELLAKGGLYRRLYEMQFRDEESEPTVAADSP